MKIKIIIFLLIISRIAYAEIRAYNYPAEVKASSAYKLKVNGTPVLVMDVPIPAAFASFELTEGSATIEIECNQDVKGVDIRPLNAGVKPQIIEGNKISFTISSPGFFSVEINGKLNNPLFIFADPKEVKPMKNDPNVIYFEAGKIHRPGIIRPKSNQQVYIEGGAIVTGAIFAGGVENVKIAGHGLFDGSLNYARSRVRAMFPGENNYAVTDSLQRFIEFIDSKNITIEGLMLINGTTWQIAPINCENVTIKGVKIVSDNSRDDGIDIVVSRKVRISDCFIRVKDDCVAIKGWHESIPDYPASVIVDDVWIEKCVFWNAAWGNGLEIGFELQCDEIKNITFRDCDIIHVESGAVFSIHNADQATVKNILYENIRVEDARQKLIDLAVFRSTYSIDGSQDNEYNRLNYLHGAWDGVLMVSPDKKDYHSQFRGKIEDIRFNNIYVQGALPFSILVGYDDNHQVKNVTFSNIYINKQKINSLDNMKLFRENTENIKIE